MDDEGSRGAEDDECSGDHWHDCRRRYPDDLPCRTRRVREWTQDIEYGADAKFTTKRGGELHCGVVSGRKHEGHAGLINAPGDGIGSEGN